MSELTDENIIAGLQWLQATGIIENIADRIGKQIAASEIARLEAALAEDAFDCVCGHHANDHDFSQRNGRGYCCGGLSESCACRDFRPLPVEGPDGKPSKSESGEG